jgi:ABC-type nitrate/sulfonate/bicarbonate transport system substrate-binding protein
MTWKRRSIHALTFLGMLCLVSMASAQDKIKITIAHPPVALHLLPIMVADDQGFFAAEGLDVQNTYMAGGSAGAAAMMGGSVEAASGAVTRAVLLQAKGIKVKLLTAMAGARDWAIVVDAKRHAGVSSVKGLKGLKIATPRRGSDGEQIVRAILEEEKMHVGADVQLVQIDGFQNQMIAIEKGDVDGAIMSEPFLTMGVQNGTLKRVLDLLEGQGPALLRNRIWTGIIVKEEFLAQNGDVAAKIVRAIKKSTQAIYDDPRMAIAVASKNMPSIGKPLLEQMIPHLLKANDPKAYLTRIDPEAIAAENEWLVKIDQIKQKIAYDDVVATSMSKLW